MPAPESFTTERLVARRVDHGDLPFLESMWSDPQVTVTLGGSRTAAEVAETLARMLDHWDRRGFGTWILRDRATGVGVGWVGIKETDLGGAGGVELLYSISSTRWREGLATEAGVAALSIAGELGLHQLVCYTLVDNVASQRTMQGLGFRGVETIEHEGMPHVLMRLDLTREETASHG